MDDLSVTSQIGLRDETPGAGDRRFEIRQANALLSAMVANSDDGIVEESMTTLATLAGLTRVQAQIGLKVLKRHGRVRHERRGTRNRPGRFEVLIDEFVSVEADDLDRAVTPRLLVHEITTDNPSPQAIAAFLISESNALRLDLEQFGARLDAITSHLRLLEALINQPEGRAASGLGRTADPQDTI
jgi:hypothetical protein